jgi:hypothetical protein
METRIAANDDFPPSPTYGIWASEELAGRTSITAGASLSPTHNPDDNTWALVVDDSHSRSNRGAIVNRLLDWSEEARGQDRLRRAEYLVWLAWEAYDRVPR